MRSIFRPGLFDGKVALVTGGGTGIGLRTARELASLGATVVLASRRVEVVTQAAESIRAAGGKAYATACNIRDEESVRAAVRYTVDTTGQLDLLVNNAGGQFPAPAETITRKGWDAVLETNLTGPFTVAREAFTAYMQAHGGAIVSVLANFRNGFPFMAHTGAARAAVDNLTKTLAWEWGRSGVRLNAVAPGIIANGGLDNYGPEKKAEILQMARFHAAGRLGDESEVAAAIVFLLSPAACYITGVTVPVDGGESLFSPFAATLARPHDKTPVFDPE